MMFVLSACYDEDSGNESSPEVVNEKPNPVQNTASKSIDHDNHGRPKTYKLIGQKAPVFSTTSSQGETISSADLEGRWTVVNFWGLYCHDSLNDAKYANALKTAIDQDPDLNYLSIHTAPMEKQLSTPFGKWGAIETFFQDKGYDEYPVALDIDAEIRDIFNIEWTPTYLLIGPDLTIESFRTDFSVDSKNGIKDFIKKIQNIKKKKTDQSARPSVVEQAYNAAPAATISSAGVAGLSSQTPFDMWAIQQAFDGYDVRAVRIETPQKDLETYEIYNEQELVMLISPDETGDWVGDATAVTPEFKGPLGETIGVSRLGDIPKDILGKCEHEIGFYKNALTCRSDNISRFARIFEIPDNYATSSGNIPSEVRQASKLIGLRFIPDNRVF